MQQDLTKQELQRQEWREYGRLFALVFPEKSRESTRKWQLKNIEHRREYERQRHLKNPHRFKLHYAKNPERCREICRRSKQKHRDRLLAEAKIRRKEDRNWHLRCVLRCRMLQALRKNWKSGSAIELLGCSIESFKAHLESQFTEGMSWTNYGKGIGKWNIDHIRPCVSFDLTKPEEQAKCFHFSNMQPLWAVDNSSKAGNIL